jgi:putative acetyltransferase
MNSFFVSQKKKYKPSAAIAKDVILPEPGSSKSSSQVKGAKLFSIRKANINDAVKIKNLHVASIQQVCASDYTSDQIEVWASNKRVSDYRQAIATGEEIMFVAERGDRVVGFVGIRSDEVRALYMHPKYLKQGIGLALLMFAEEQLKKSGIKTARLSATLNAQNFYLKHGWKVSDGPTSITIGIVSAPCVSMYKNL